MNLARWNPKSHPVRLSHFRTSSATNWLSMVFVVPYSICWQNKILLCNIQSYWYTDKNNLATPGTPDCHFFETAMAIVTFTVNDRDFDFTTCPISRHLVLFQRLVSATSHNFFLKDIKELHLLSSFSGFMDFILRLP